MFNTPYRILSAFLALSALQLGPLCPAVAADISETTPSHPNTVPHIRRNSDYTGLYNLRQGDLYTLKNGNTSDAILAISKELYTWFHNETTDEHGLCGQSTYLTANNDANAIGFRVAQYTDNKDKENHNWCNTTQRAKTIVKRVSSAFDSKNGQGDTNAACFDIKYSHDGKWYGLVCAWITNVGIPFDTVWSTGMAKFEEATKGSLFTRDLAIDPDLEPLEATNQASTEKLVERDGMVIKDFAKSKQDAPFSAPEKATTVVLDLCAKIVSLSENNDCGSTSGAMDDFTGQAWSYHVESGGKKCETKASDYKLVHAVDDHWGDAEKSGYSAACWVMTYGDGWEVHVGIANDSYKDDVSKLCAGVEWSTKD